MSESIVWTFGELAAQGHVEFGDGYRTKQAEYGQPGLPILRVAEVLDGKIEPELADFVHSDYRPRMGNKVSRPGDVVITTKGTVGRVALIPRDSPELVYSPQVCFFLGFRTSGRGGSPGWLRVEEFFQGGGDQPTWLILGGQ
jgi:type I restriction enzyme, S subunit